MTAAGTLLDDRYRLGARIASGGTAAVYEGTDLWLERTVAVKRLHPHLAGTRAAQALRDEGRLLSQLPHRHLVTCFDVSAEEAFPYLVLERLCGPDLISLAGKSGIDHLDYGIDVAVSLCHTLAYLHGRGVLHRDLKPQHVLLDRGKRVVLIDLGLATAPPPMSGAERVAGSAAYLAHEVRAGEPPTVASDLYALGVVLYRLFTGHLPVDSETGTIAMRHAKTAIPRIRERRPELPAYLDSLVARLLAKRAAERPGSASEVAEMLRGEANAAIGKRRVVHSSLYSP